MYFEQINIEETHIRLTTDLNNQQLKKYIYNIRFDLKTYIQKNKLFQLSLEPIKVNEDNYPQSSKRCILHQIFVMLVQWHVLPEQYLNCHSII